MPASLRAVPAIVTRLSSGSVAAQKPAARTTFSRPKRSMIRDNVGVISRCVYTQRSMLIILVRIQPEQFSHVGPA